MLKFITPASVLLIINTWSFRMPPISITKLREVYWNHCVHLSYLSVHVSKLCPELIFWTAQPFVTTLGMVVHHPETECHEENINCCLLSLWPWPGRGLPGQGHSDSKQPKLEGHNNEAANLCRFSCTGERKKRKQFYKASTKVTVAKMVAISTFSPIVAISTFSPISLNIFKRYENIVHTIWRQYTGSGRKISCSYWTLI